MAELIKEEYLYLMTRSEICLLFLCKTIKLMISITTFSQM